MQIKNLEPRAKIWTLAIVLLVGARTFAQNWPSFRGLHASGVADGQHLPLEWNAEEDLNIKWKIRIPGLAHSSPVIWDERLFVTTAISGKGDDGFKPGLYGEGTASTDDSTHQWKVYALNKRTGEILWDRVAYEGIPEEKRHIKGTYANATPATNGRYLVVLFGSQGLYAYDFEGVLVWKRDLGRMDLGAYDAPEYEWGTASSPIIYEDKVIVQVDTQREDYLLAVDIESGKTVWKKERQELPSWGTPTIYPGKSRVELVTNASNFICGYNPDTGDELWRLGGSSQITAPTPTFSGDLIIVASGRRPEKPIFVIRAGANGDITLPVGESSSEDIAWSLRGRGSYMPSPLVYQGNLYILQNQGILDCYELETGKELYRGRIPHQGSGFSASPVAADGVVYLAGEDGDIFAVKAGPEFELLAQNNVGELLMATPALSDGMMFIRAHQHVLAVGR